MEQQSSGAEEADGKHQQQQKTTYRLPDLNNLQIRTRSIEQTLIPLVTQVSNHKNGSLHLIFKGEEKKNNKRKVLFFSSVATLEDDGGVFIYSSSSWH